MMTYNRIILGLIVLMVSFSYGQERKLKRADKAYESYAYINAIEIYEKVAEDGYKSKEVFEKLANAYYFNANLEKASKWYGELFAMGEEGIAPEYYFRYAQSLKSQKRYDESDKMMEAFHKLTSEDSRGDKFTNAPNYLEDIEAQSGRYRIENLGINSSNSDFAPSFYRDNELVFSSARDTGIVTRYKHDWNEKPFLDLYGATIVDNGSLDDANKFSGKLNTKYHESTSVFTKDGETMYFTRNNYYKGKYKKDKKGINKLKLFRAKLKNGRWTAIEELPFNSNEYSVAHPALSVDEKQLYFASDMPGTVGLSDLYVVDINEDGTFGEPKNLGKGINTEGRETFPFISNNNELYFASDGHIGLGGLDVFVMNLKDEEKLIFNVGEPINSPMDDFTFIINNDTKKGYFASNRKGGKGDDDIYSFVEVKQIEQACEQEIAGFVKDEKTNEPLIGAEVILLDNENKQIETIYSDDRGRFRFKQILACNEAYFIRASKKDYNTAEELLPKQEESGLREVTLLLEKDEQIIQPCDDLAKILNIPIIHFDFDKYNIRPDAEVELQKVFAVLNKYPSMTIEIRSHTDCRGSNSYNETLSDNRAKSTRQYLIDKGISANRITAKGYGEYRLVNDCGCEPTNDSNCSDEEHQENRRSEFIVTSFKGQKCNED